MIEEIGSYRGTKSFYFIIYVFVFVGFYGVIPNYFVFQNALTQQMYQLTIISAVTVSAIIWFPKMVLFERTWIEINCKDYFWAVSTVFILISSITIITAPTIPIFDSINGASQQELIEGREEFLKARDGIGGQFLNYSIGMINTYLLPYAIIWGIMKKVKYVWIVVAYFFLFSFLTLEKAYFLRLLIPLFIYYFFVSRYKITYLLISVSTVFGLLILMFILSGFDGSELSGSGGNAQFFSMLYAPQNPIDSIMKRSLVVPLITALDGLQVFSSAFSSEFFNGDTSSLIAFFKGAERINFERYLYQYQFGGSDTGNANQMYLIEAFINFGITGVVLFSGIVAFLIRSFVNSKDIGLISICPLIIYNLFNAGLIASLFSSGLILLVGFRWIIRFK